MKALGFIVCILGTIVCGPMVLYGATWIAEGVGLLAHSQNSGRAEWAAFGALLLLPGSALALWLNRKRL
jgi:hypothetical protein